MPPKKPPVSDLKQQCVQILRPEDQFMVVQGGQQKLMLVAAFTQALKDLMASEATTAAVPAHSHAESDVTNLGTDLTALLTAINGKAALNHTHLISDIKSDYIDGTTNPDTVYDGVYPVLKKATVAAGNAVFFFTDDNTATGVALFPNGPIPSSVVFRPEEGTNPCACGVPVWSNGNRTLTVPVSRVGAALTILGLSVLGATVAANGVVIYATAFGK